jgi:2-polyprenyl-3-methyl-5-hydroxy-6-metoxy-1,4-benzoquinol methylase
MGVDSLFPDLSERRHEPEIMDSPGLDPNQHAQALRGLARINLLSLAARRVWQTLQTLPRFRDHPVRVLDVACGGGDIVMALKKKADTAGIALEVHGCDVNPIAIGFARDLARERGLDVQFFQHDAKDELPGDFDLVCSSLFLHHLSEDEALAFLQALMAAGKAVVLQDLLRTRLGHLLALATVPFLTGSPVVRVDGVRSVIAAFSLSEVEQMARQAGLKGVRIRPCWPERFSLYWAAS